VCGVIRARSWFGCLVGVVDVEMKNGCFVVALGALLGHTGRGIGASLENAGRARDASLGTAGRAVGASLGNTGRGVAACRSGVSWFRHASKRCACGEDTSRGERWAAERIGAR
jgi:hypothetical protein